MGGLAADGAQCEVIARPPASVLRHESLSRLFKSVDRSFRLQLIGLLRDEGMSGLAPGLAGILLHLGDEDKITTSELARRCELENSTLTPLIDEMERRGLLARERAPEDRRVVRLHMTAEGRRLEPKLRALVLGLQDRAFAGIPATDLALFENVLRRMLVNLTGTESI